MGDIIPDAKKCCFCVPLRRGLLGVGYFKLVCSNAGLGIVLFFTIILICFDALDGLLTAFLIVAIITLLLESIFSIIFVMSAHKKNYKYFRIYYYFSIAELVSYVILLTICITWITTTDLLELVLGGVSFFLILMVLHIYFVYLVRSEMRKLQINTLFSFKNHLDEPECSAQIVE